VPGVFRVLGLVPFFKVRWGLVFFRGARITAKMEETNKAVLEASDFTFKELEPQKRDA
jgi:hypothetical protein